jgi:hypothetical protein
MLNQNIVIMHRYSLPTEGQSVTRNKPTFYKTRRVILVINNPANEPSPEPARFSPHATFLREILILFFHLTQNSQVASFSLAYANKINFFVTSYIRDLFATPYPFLLQSA